MQRFSRAAGFAAAVALLVIGAAGAWAQTEANKPAGPRGEIYGFAQADFGYDFK